MEKVLKDNLLNPNIWKIIKNDSDLIEFENFKYIWNKIIDIKYLEDFYFSLCKEFELDFIWSSTLIEWKTALDFLFDRIVNDITWYDSLSKNVDELILINSQAKNKDSLKFTVKEKKIKIMKVLYWFKDNFDYLLLLTREFWRIHKTDLFVNALVRIDMIYMLASIRQKKHSL